MKSTIATSDIKYNENGEISSCKLERVDIDERVFKKCSARVGKEKEKKLKNFLGENNIESIVKNLQDECWEWKTGGIF